MGDAAFKYLSVCSGIEAATMAWHGLGWEPAAYSEIEKFPRAVLQHHYPDVPRYKALGNSWGVPVFEWVGRRISMMERLIQEQEA